MAVSGVAKRQSQAGATGADASERSTLLGARNNRDDDQDDLGSETSTGDIVIDDFAGMPWWRKPTAFWLLGPFFIFTLAFGGVIVPKLDLILDLVCKQYLADRQAHDPDFSYAPVILGSDNPQCDIKDIQKQVQKKATLFMMAINFTTGILSAIVAPNLGRLSDRYGRTRLMALASVGGILNEIMTILAAKFSDTVDYRWLILGATFDGLTGSFTAGSILSQSYTSDCTAPSKRSVSMGYIHACLFGGLAFGPLLAGQFVKWTGSLLTIFYVVLGCHVFFMLFVAFVVPESVSKRRRLLATEIWLKQKKADEALGDSLVQLISNAHPFRPLAILWPKHRGVSRKLRINLVALAVTDVIIMGSMIALGGVMVYYTELVFGWHTVEKSRFISALSMVRVFVLMVILPLINYFGRTRPAARKLRENGGVVTEKRAGADRLDIWILRFAIISDIVGSIGYASSRTPAPFILSGAITAFGGLGSATIQAVVTKHVPQERVGQILGAIGMLHALARIAMPLMFSSLYAATLDKFPQAVFILLSCIFVVALVASSFVKPHIYWEDAATDETEPLNRNWDDTDTIIAEATIEEDQLRLQ